MGRIKSGIGIAVLAGAVLAGATACGGDGKSTAADATKPAGHQKKSSPKAKASPTPKGPPMLLETIFPKSGDTVGVAMPISVTFTKPVATSARAGIEKHLKLTSSTPVTGAWHWFSDTRVDFRPKSYWPAGTKVSVDADFAGVPDGNGRYGTHSYKHDFTIGDDVETKISVPGHSMKVYKDNKLVRTMPIDAGSPSYPSWDGTMAVIDKAREVHMTSCSVNISCNKGDPNYYDLTLPWDVHLTNSGTYVHYSTGDPSPGHSYGSHGCVHLSLSDAKWFYNYVKQGDPITISGSPRGKAAGDNGYADYNVDWTTWLKASGAGEMTVNA